MPPWIPSWKSCEILLENPNLQFKSRPERKSLDDAFHLLPSDSLTFFGGVIITSQLDPNKIVKTYEICILGDFNITLYIHKSDISKKIDILQHGPSPRNTINYCKFWILLGLKVICPEN